MTAQEQSRGARKRLWLAAGVSLVTLSLLAVSVHEPLKVRYLAHRVAGADTPEEEIEAFRLVNQWSSGYFVHLFDRNGERLFYKDLTDFSKVAIVEIEWRGLRRVRKRLTREGNLGQLLRE